MVVIKDLQLQSCAFFDVKDGVFQLFSAACDKHRSRANKFFLSPAPLLGQKKIVYNSDGALWWPRAATATSVEKFFIVTKLPRNLLLSPLFGNAASFNASSTHKPA